MAYDNRSREHRHGLEKLDRAYRSTAKLLASAEFPAEPEEDRAPAPSALLNVLEAILEMKRARKAEAEKMEAEDMPEINDEVIEQLFGIPKGSGRREDGDKTDRPVEPDLFSAELREKFPELFAAEFASACIPAGWRRFTILSLRMFRATGLPARICSLGLSRGRLEAEGNCMSGQAVYHPSMPPHMSSRRAPAWAQSSSDICLRLLAPQTGTAHQSLESRASPSSGSPPSMWLPHIMQISEAA